jgi:hypothetical protein
MKKIINVSPKSRNNIIFQGTRKRAMNNDRYRMSYKYLGVGERISFYSRVPLHLYCISPHCYGLSKINA